MSPLNSNYDINEIASIINDASRSIILSFNAAPNWADLKSLAQTCIRNLNLSVRHKYYVNAPEVVNDGTVIKIDFHFAGREKEIIVCFKKDQNNNTTAMIEGPGIVVSSDLEEPVLKGLIHSDCVSGNSILYLDWFTKVESHSIGPVQYRDFLWDVDTKQYDRDAVNRFLNFYNQLEDAETDHLRVYDIYITNISDKQSSEYSYLKAFLADTQNHYTHLVIGSSWIQRKKSYSLVAAAIDNLYLLGKEIGIPVIFCKDYQQQRRETVNPQLGIDAIERYYANDSDQQIKAATIRQFCVDYGIVDQ
ncbi:MAG: hypothetical protein IJ879_02745 [Muribaculaceae bacterium]|nr:hypothetical protein [Muribaculaceae bacterium]